MAGIGSFAAAGTTTREANYIGERLVFLLGTAVPTALTVTAQGIGTILQLDAAGFQNMRNLLRKNLNGNLYASFDLANGQIPLMGSALKVTMTLGAGTAAEGYIKSRKAGTVIKQTEIVTCKASTPTLFERFSYLGLKNMTAGDILNIAYNDGHEETLVTTQDLIDEASRVQALNLVVSDNQVVFNDTGNIKRVSYTPVGSDRAVYVQRIAAASPQSISNI